MKTFIVILLAVIGFQVSIKETFGQGKNISSGNALITVQKDVFTSPVKFKNQAYPLGIAFGVVGAGLIASDEAFQREIQQFIQPRNNLYTNFKQLTDFGGTFALIGYTGATYLTGLVAKNERLKQTGLQLGIGLATTATATFATKWLFGRQRPYVDGTDHWYFFQFSDDRHAFFSGHSSGIWTVATIFSKQYREHKWLQAVCYSTAAIISASRVIINKHWVSDVFIGSAVGYGIGTLVNQTFENQHLRLFPIFGLQQSGALLQLTF